jgi:uncharacterized protein with LGFP repeats
MLNRLYQILIGLASGALITFLIAHSYYTEKIQRLYAELEVKAKTEDLDNLQKQRDTENYFINLQNAVEAQALNEYDQISVRFNSFDFSAEPHGLQQQDHTSDNATALSGSSTAATKTTAACDCGRLRQTYNTLKRTCGILAKERDELAVDRNELIKLYNQVRAQYGTQDYIQKDSGAAAIRQER